MSVRRFPALLLGVACAFAARTAELKDPTQPPISEEVTRIPPRPHPMPIVSAIFLSPTRSVAVFNDQPVQVGDRVGEFRIDEISKRGVRFTTAGHTGFAALNRTH